MVVFQCLALLREALTLVAEGLGILRLTSCKVVVKHHVLPSEGPQVEVCRD